MSDGPYLILHKVRGEPAFDIAEQVMLGDEEGWVTSTYGHRAYPVWHAKLSSLYDIEQRPIPLGYHIPADWPEHFEIKEAPKSAKSTGKRAIAFLQNLGVLPQETDRRA
jgi:hypothetical protein